ncbi:MAG TPA: hypothetical protein PK230_03835, partial [Chitinophagales bacterium]|nr:hypothetical protein [Chitinophagales bacterium]
NSVSINAINLQMTYPNGLAGNVTGTACTFNVTAELPPCPTSVNITTPTQVCSGGSVDFTNSNPGNIRFIITSDAGFSYNNIGFPADYPTNTTCAPITVTYNITAQCTNNNSTLFTGTRTVTVYPDIDLSAVIIDNTTNINDPNCAVLVTAPCPTFTINGQGGGSASLPVSPGDNGTVASVAIGNGFCTENINVPLTCIGSCVPPTTSVTTNCPTSNNFSIVVQVTDMGDLSSFVLQPSQGNPQTITQIGTYTFAGNANNSVVNIKVLSIDNPSCNTNLGNFTEACKNCPSITNVLVTNGGSICSGANIGLSATVPNATENVDYQIQWQLNGTDIPGANTRQYAYTAYETGCQPQIYNFTARIICLNNGNPPASDTYNVNPITVYPIPQYGTDFFAPDDCSVVPIASPDCANFLTITTNPTPPGIVAGQQIMVSYSVRVNGAPSTCFASGRFLAGCPTETCTEDAGAMEPSFQQVCWNEDFLVVKSTPPLGLGFRNYIKVIDEAGTQVATYGPYQSTDVVPPFEFTNDNSSTYQAGHTYCFTPTLLFNGRDLNSGQAGIQTAYPVTDSGNLPPLPGACITSQTSPDCTSNIEPYIYSFTVEGIPYCPSVSSYNVTFTWNDNNTVFNPIGNNILIGTLPGVGITSDFPGALSSISDDGTYSIVYNGNPNGKTFNFLAIQPNPLAGCNWNWNLTITLNDPPTFPVVCPSCNDVGESACVQLLPSNPVGTIATPAPVCVGSTVDLHDYNPTSSQSGTYVWYAADPATGAAPLANPSAVEITQTSTFYVEYETNVGECATTRTVTFAVTQPPTLNTPTAAPICPGTSVNLTLLQPQITTAAGTFTWYIGDPENGGARLNTATSITPIGSEKYYCVFTSNQTGCSNSVYIVYTYHPIPLLLPQAPSICTGTQVNLRNFEAAINPNPGTFIWTNSSGTVLNPNASNQILVTPTNGAFFDVAYTDAVTGCSNEGRAVTFTVNANTPLSAPTVSPVCSGTEISLTALQPAMTNATGGTFTWTTGGNPVPNPSAVVLNATTTFNASYTNASGCVSNRNVTYTVNPGPTVLTQNLSIPAVCPATAVDLTAYQT